MKLPSYLPGLLVGVYALAIILVYKHLSLTALLISLGSGAVAHSVTDNLTVSSGIAIVTLFVMVAVMPRNASEGFNTHTGATEISGLLRKVKAENLQKEGFMGSVAHNIQANGYSRPGFGMDGPLVEGYEDVKKEKDEKPAPASKKDTLPMPFTLGEIPSQAKNGPHIDAGSTLIKAIQSLNPDQINAMTKDTQQLIDTQKSLMGMLGTMKPMLNDGKQLMETFQQMFGQ
jgi:hypothetical protein